MTDATPPRDDEVSIFVVLYALLILAVAFCLSFVAVATLRPWVGCPVVFVGLYALHSYGRMIRSRDETTQFSATIGAMFGIVVGLNNIFPGALNVFA